MPPVDQRVPRSARTEKANFKRAWKESHGNAILGFAALIFLCGLIAIWLSPESPQEPDLDLLVAPGANAPPEVPTDSIRVRVATNAIASSAPIRIAIYDSKDSFGDPEKAIIKDSLVPANGFATWDIQLDSLPEEFAVAAYHDLDENEELNRGLFNAPEEPYGFSNNARSIIGPPTYEQTLVKRPDDPIVMEVNLR